MTAREQEVIQYRVTSSCTLCEACMSACPVGAIVPDSMAARIDTGRCLGCGRCMSVCMSGAIEWYRV